MRGVELAGAGLARERDEVLGDDAGRDDRFDAAFLQARPGQLTWANLKRGFTMLFKVCWKLGVLADYRQAFWSYAWPRFKEGRIEEVISTGIIAKHLIAFARKACAGELNASHYSAKVR